MGSAEEGSQSGRLVPRSVWGRVISALASSVLRSQTAHDRDSWEHGDRNGYHRGWNEGTRAGYTKGFDIGRAQGHEAGAVEGHQRGYGEGFEAGKCIIELRPGRLAEAVAPGIDNKLFGRWAFPITQEMQREVKAAVREHLKGQEPTADQWKMIFSTNPSTCVGAGAGSGKSTTMVLRLLVLHRYLGIPKENIAVVTFTRESRKDFRKKLTDVFALWSIPLTEDDTKRMVRTFHSRILDFIRWSQNHNKVTAFEFFALKSEEEEEEQLEKALDLRLTSEQLELMNTAYQNTFQSNETFRVLISQLVRNASKLDPMSSKSDVAKRRAKRLAESSQRDGELTVMVDRLWHQSGFWPMDGVEPGPFRVELAGREFFANGYCEELKAYVILGAGKNDRKAVLESDPKMTLAAATTMKKTFFQVHGNDGLIFLDNYAEAGATLDVLRGYVTRCPKFYYQIQGELGEAPIMEAFHSAASFLENLGLDVTDAVGQMSFPEKSADALFFHALAIFWPAFNEYLARQFPPIFTFNKMFEMFGERGAQNLQELPDDVFKPMLHLLVDEFQDCGANTISWLRAVFRESRHRGLKISTDSASLPASLMAVGDDWQSIYGWRGSSPKFFMDFEAYFPAHQKTRVLMRENYRSQQMVIDAAESLLDGTPTLDGKFGIAAHTKVKDLRYPVQVLDRNDDTLAELVERHFDQDETVLVLYRKNDTKRQVRGKLSNILRKAKRLEREGEIKLLTYHGSKGLEADAVFLVGDCAQMSTSPYRNMAYDQAALGLKGDPTPYDTAQGEETLRLAYVAITRAKKHCYWFVEQPKTPPGLVSALKKVPFDKPFFMDLRNQK